MAIDTARLVNAFMTRFGEPCTLTVQGVEHDLSGIFSAPRVGAGIGGVPVQPTEPVLSVRGTDLDDLGELVGVTVAVRGRQFNLGRVLPGDDGLTDLELRELFL